MRVADLLRCTSSRTRAKRRRAEAMGCGKAERLVYLIDSYSAELMPHSMFEALCDPAARLRQQGSFSIPHLLADGYTPEQVEEIVERGHAFDLAERGS